MDPEGYKNTYLRGLLRVLNELIIVKCSSLYLEHSVCCISVSSHYLVSTEAGLKIRSVHQHDVSINVMFL